MSEERDPTVSQRYRELGREEPPRELDQAILAAADRGRDRPHAPLVAPAGRHRWYYALGAAAIAVLAVAVTVQIEREQPDPEVAAPVQPESQARRDEPAPRAARESVPPQVGVPPASPPFTPDPPAQPRSDAPARAKPKAPPKVAPPEKIAAPTAADSAAPRAEASSAPEARARLGGVAAPGEAPERWLERIVQLRKEGRGEEADRELAEFRKRYPDFQLPEAALKAGE